MGLELDLEGGQHNRSVGRRKMSILESTRSNRSNLTESNRSWYLFPTLGNRKGMEEGITKDKRQ